MSDTLGRIVDLVANQSGVPAAELTTASAIDQDVRLVGDDVTELVAALAKEFGEQVSNWPWQSFATLSEPSVLTLPHVARSLLNWLTCGNLSKSSRFERLELGHIAAVIDRGEWFQP